MEVYVLEVFGIEREKFGGEMKRDKLILCLQRRLLKKKKSMRERQRCWALPDEWFL